MDHFKQLATFVHVAQRGSLSAAARHEEVTTAVVSRRLDALEARLGTKLLLRTTRRVTLTPEGSAFVEDCQRVLRDLQDAEAAVAARSAEAHGELRVTAPAGFGRSFVAPLLARYRVRHPRVHVILDLTDRTVDLAGEGYDCAIRFGEHADGSLVRVPLGASRRVVVGAPAYLAAHGAPRTPADLAHHHGLLLAAGGTESATRGWTLRIDGRLSTLSVAGGLVCNDGAVLRDWALQGLGLAWRSMWEVAEDVAQGRLVTLLDAYAGPPTQVWCLFADRKHQPYRIRSFIDLVREAFATDAMRAALEGTAPRTGRAPPAAVRGKTKGRMKRP
jgi:DNA-binding transcriptional LysR family regulator